MEVIAEQKTRNTHDGKTYKKTVYVCRTDDIWGQYEIPEAKA
jgi:hypothetical protein